MNYCTNCEKEFRLRIVGQWMSIIPSADSILFCPFCGLELDEEEENGDDIPGLPLLA